MEKIDLPIDIEKSDLVTPTNPDTNWLIKMLALLLIVFLIGYGMISLFSYIILKNLSVETEKEFLSEIITYIGDFEKFDDTQLKTKIDISDVYNLYITDSQEINAYATLGSNIIINKGLIESLNWEEELLFIIGHESGHVENRDVLKSILNEIPLSFGFWLIGGQIDIDINKFNNIAKSYRDKKIEMLADNTGADFINNLELNLNCSLGFFNEEEDKFLKYLSFIGSHPTNEARIKNLEGQVLYGDKDCTPLEYNFDF